MRAEWGGWVRVVMETIMIEHIMGGMLDHDLIGGTP